MSNEYQLSRGESKIYTGVVRNSAGELVDLSNAEIYFVVRDLTGEIVLAKKSPTAGGNNDQIEIPDQTADDAALKGTYYLKIGTDDSNIAPTARWADCWLVTDAEPPEYIKVDEHAPFYITGDEPPAFA